ncbi:MAG: hypothetical protein ACR2LC_07685 [Pyrinomonadaceae bacterium]
MTSKNDALCLILGPLDGEFDLVRETINEILVGLGIRPIRIDDRTYGIHLSESVLQDIAKADLIIADITGSNPNVMYELGFAHALKKPVLQIVEKEAGNIPFDLAGSLYYSYDSPKRPNEIKKFKEKFGETIANWAQRSLSYA